jgi:undecaprenyl-diphosphatase
MSMPIIAAAVVLKGPEALRTNGVTAPLVIGVVSAAASGWLAISVLLRYVSRNSYGIFALYRVVLGVVVLVILYTRG